MSNYTKPNDPGHKDEPNDWLMGSLIFAKAIACMLREGQGIVLELEGEMKLPGYPDCKKVLVFYLDGMVNIIPADEHEDWEEGDSVNVLDFNNN